MIHFSCQRTLHESCRFRVTFKTLRWGILGKIEETLLKTGRTEVARQDAQKWRDRTPYLACFLEMY